MTRHVLSALTIVLCGGWTLAQTVATELPPHAATYTHEAVAADHPLASAAGEEILAKGGNAVDAAVATSFALSVVRPFSCGIGGGGFMVIVLPAHDGKPAVCTAINYRETCPAGVGPDYYEKLIAKEGDPAKDSSKHGGRSVAVPATMVGLLYALDTYGTLKREDVLAPAVRLAREGYAADGAYARAAADAIAKFREHRERQIRFAFTWEHYLRSGSVREGDRIVVPEQARALELLARDGVRAYTDGEIGRAVVAACAGDGGAVTLEDIRGYKPNEVGPLRFEALGCSFVTMPPPSSGGVAMAETLGILERADGPTAWKRGETVVFTHLLVESFKHAFADRAEWMADPAFVRVPTERLLSDPYLNARAKHVDPTRLQAPELYGTREEDEEHAAPADHGTSHLCVVDAHGGAVACTETINLVFGSYLAVPEFGFILNDQMDDFTTVRGRPNAFGLVQSDRNLPAPGKRPLSSMTPTVVLDKGGNVEAVCGASGGPRIITGTTQVLINALLLDLPAGEAVARPRLHHQWMPNVLEIEEGYPGRWEGTAVPIWLTKLHHQTVQAKETAAVQLIKRVGHGADAKWEAASDPRKGGKPAGR